jgi:hypothetical protein
MQSQDLFTQKIFNCYTILTNFSIKIMNFNIVYLPNS